MSDPVSNGIRFSSYCQPPLVPGNYKVRVQQTVKVREQQRVTDLRPSPFVAPDFDFVVAGPRFALNPADIYSVYPPEGSSGNFASSLPHVVFTRRTIPWERQITSDTPVERPWMALLLFNSPVKNEGAAIPKIEPRKVSDLVCPQPSDGVTGPQNLKYESYELNDPCNIIDIDAGLFGEVAPTYADLSYLAHVREVNTDDKETVSFLTDGTFSVVIGNRFPKPQGNETVENTAVLVSLEGMREFLPGEQSQVSTKKLRLAVLASWAFRCNEEVSFKSSMEKLGTTLLPLRLALPEDDGTQSVQTVRAAFSRGYTALNHHTRLGEKTFSWYRGPLIPLGKEASGNYDFKAVPDALVRYDYQNGLMDLTYAGAAQLGRLLGLQDRSFAQALTEWRTDVQRQIKSRMQKEALRRNLRSEPADEPALLSPDSVFLESALMESMISKQTEQTATESDSGTFAKALTARGEEWLPDQLPVTVRDWLARRVLLYGVPFLYLVPDERMLPLPSMRFFRIDPQWIKRLLEGACSVGRNSTEEETVDSHLGDRFFDIAVTGSATVRRRTLSVTGNANKNAGASPSPVFPFEGFLLRSPIVRDWQGLEMEAKYWKDGKKVPAPALRIDRLAPDVMLCIFNGPLADIEIRQPPEGMHFGASEFEKTMVRNVTAIDPGAQKDLKDYPTWHLPRPPYPGPTPHALKIPFRGSKDFRVVNVKELAELFYDALTGTSSIDHGAPITSAEFGVQMTDSPGRVTITVRKQHG